MLCGCPERASDLLNEATLIQGELKEKHGKYRFLRRWRKRLYSLTNGNIVYYKKDMVSWGEAESGLAKGEIIVYKITKLYLFIFCFGPCFPVGFF